MILPSLFRFSFSFLFGLLANALFALWFLVQDRRLVFLYGHLQTTPFDPHTLSRHWVTALVASAVLFFVSVAAFVAGKHLGWARREMVPKVWIWTSILSFPGIFVIGQLGTPRLPLPLQLFLFLITFGAMGLALFSAAALVWKPKEAVLRWLDGVSLVPTLFFTPLLADFLIRKSGSGTNVVSSVVVVVLVMTVGTSIWFVLMRWLQRRLRQKPFAPHEQMLSALFSVYLLLPLAHYITSRPEHWYVSNSQNFSSQVWWVQLGTFLLISVLAVFLGWLRGRFSLVEKKNVFLVLSVLAAFSLLSSGMVSSLASHTTDNIWLCEDGIWKAVGEPNYERPFEFECPQDSEGKKLIFEQHFSEY